MKISRLYDYIVLIICIGFIVAVLINLQSRKKRKIVVLSLIGISNPEKGLCKFTGHSIGETSITEFEDTCCKFAIGDTIEISQ